MCYLVADRVAHLDNVVVTHKDVDGLDVPVNDLMAVKRLQALANLNEVLPDDLFRERLFELCAFSDEA